MKRFFTYTLSIAMLTGMSFMTSCGFFDKKEEVKEQPEEQVIVKAIPDGNYVATGSFNGKYPITMEFTVKDHKLAGRYYYDRMGPDNSLQIVGRVDTAFVEIQEFDGNGDNTGSFRGDVTDNSISGLFTAMSNGNVLPFEINFSENDGGPNYLNIVSYVDTFDFGPELEPTNVEVEIDDEPAEPTWWEKIMAWFK